jgi:integrase
MTQDTKPPAVTISGAGVAAPSTTPAAILPPESTPAAVVQWYATLLQFKPPELDGTAESDLKAAYAYVGGAKALNSCRTYLCSVRNFIRYCIIHDLPCFPASPETVAAYLAHEHRNKRAIKTLEVRRAAIRHYHILAGFTPPPTDHTLITEGHAGQRRASLRAGKTPRKVRAITHDLLLRILACIPDDLPGLRDRVILVFGYLGCLRAIEAAKIEICHLERTSRGLVIKLPMSKNDQAGHGYNIPIPYHAEFKPIEALERWLKAAQITDGPIFRRLRRSPPGRRASRPRKIEYKLGDRALTAQSISSVVKRRAAAIGIDPATVAGHSLRRGALTSASNSGASISDLLRLARHRSLSSLLEYLEIRDAFDNHPL